MMLQKVYLVHDFLYGSLDSIPDESLDGKSTIDEIWIVTDVPIVEADSNDYYIYHSEKEAYESQVKYD
ncbi:hypothetical protein ABE144_16165 [Brevibacillus laterosporus]|uniref:hypothetical protein n=1 Tax=Brevibacillus laterosporus TaxID=1465 RepID=UPI003D230FF6